MKKIILLALLSLEIAACGTRKVYQQTAQNSGSGSTGVGNGGAAIRRNGNLLLIGAAGVLLEDAQPLQTVPGADLAIDVANRLLLPESAKGALLRALRPQRGYRNFYNIRPDEMDASKHAEILGEYLKIISAPVNEIELVAITSGHDTYLFPAFYELSKNSEKAAILFHEALWSMNKNLSYKSVVRTETAIHKIMESPNLPEKIYNLDLMQALKDGFANPYLGLAAAALYDFSNGPRKITFPKNGLVQNGEVEIRELDKPQFKLIELLGHETIDLIASEFRLNTDIAYVYLDKMRRLNPDLKFLDEIMIELDNLELAKVTDNGRSGYQINATSASSRWQQNEQYGNEEFDLLKPYERFEGWPVESFHGFWTGRAGISVQLTGMRGRNGSIGYSASPTQKNVYMMLYLANYQNNGCTVVSGEPLPGCIAGRKLS